jgi:hypothetical protein
MVSVLDKESIRGRAAALQAHGGDGGGIVNDILRRLGIVEASVQETGGDVREIKGALPHLATRADLHAHETRILRWLIGTVITVATLAFSIAKFVN